MILEKIEAIILGMQPEAITKRPEIESVEPTPKIIRVERIRVEKRNPFVRALGRIPVINRVPFIRR